MGFPENRSLELMTPTACVRGGDFCDPPSAGFFVCVSWTTREARMSNVWLQSALWMALALVAAMGSLYITISAALFEIVVGAIAGNTIGLPLTDWISYIAGFGAVVLTFLAGTDIDPHVVKRNFGSSVSIGLMGFFAPYIGCLLLAHYGLGWPWPQAQIAGIALSTTSVAVVYAVMVETGYNRTELGKIILAACFINDIGTVLALGLIFANYNLYLLLFAVVTVVAVAVLPWVTPWIFKRIGGRASEPEIKFLFLILFGLWRSRQSRQERGGLTCLPRRYGARAILFGKPRPSTQDASNLLCLSYSVLLSQGRFLDRSACVDYGSRSSSSLPRGEDGDEIRRHPATDTLFQIRQTRGHVHNDDDVDGTYLRFNLGPIRTDEPHHRSGSVYGTLDGRHRKRGRPNIDRADLVSPAFRAAGGGCLRTRSRPLRRMTFGGSVVSIDEVTLRLPGSV